MRAPTPSCCRRIRRRQISGRSGVDHEPHRREVERDPTIARAHAQRAEPEPTVGDAIADRRGKSPKRSISGIICWTVRDRPALRSRGTPKPRGASRPTRHRPQAVRVWGVHGVAETRRPDDMVTAPAHRLPGRLCQSGQPSSCRRATLGAPGPPTWLRIASRPRRRDMVSCERLALPSCEEAPLGRLEPCG